MVEVTFNINYWTKFGETVALVGNLSQIGDWNPNNAKRMMYRGDGNWALDLQFDANTQLEYRYCVLRTDDSFVYENGSKRVVNLKDITNASSVAIYDNWKAPSSTDEVNPHLRASVFTDVIFGRQIRSAPSSVTFTPADAKDKVLVQIKLYSIFVPPQSVLRVAGSPDVFGNWKQDQAPVMSDANYPFWELKVVIPKSQIPFNYKFVVTDKQGKNEIWEERTDRYFNTTDKSAVIVDGGKFIRTYNFWKGSGVSIPVFSLRTTKSLGVGEFNDIKPLVDWAAQCNFKVVQILPVNDTCSRLDWRDSYPYSSISVFALHPIYMHLPALTTDATLLADIAANQKKLNSLPQLDYEAVLKYKTEIMRKIYKTSRDTLFGTAEYKSWYETNEHWLAPYALFCVLRDKYRTSDYSQWPEYSNITRDVVKQKIATNSPFYEDIAYYFFVQYHLHKQLKDASDYAASHRIGIKGDIAIGVNRNSVDSWIAPHLYKMNRSTGAPPDAFAAEGQNWGFPTYDWDEMAKDDYSWWRSRLTHMAQYFHAFRIDHILGFFRIWEIPTTAVTGLFGRFSPCLPVWRSELESNGLWDINRLTKPYIRTHLIQRYFGANYDIIGDYFDVTGPGSFQFKPQYSTEKQIAAALPTTPSASLTEEQAKENATIKAYLFQLLQNVILLTDPDDPNKFYPRIEMMKTTSYAEMPDGPKESLRRLYVDFYYHRQESLWAATALQRLPVMINSTKMLCCGEDLGMVPACVQPVLNKLNILGLRIQRMPSDPKVEFMHPADYPYLTVCTPSVHDTSTLRGWWEEDRGTTQRFWNHILGEHGAAPYFCDEHSTVKVINQHIYSPSMWSIFMMQDLFGLSKKYYEGIDPKSERINEPSNPEHYWKYRMHVNVEDLVNDKEFSEKIQGMLRHAGRSWPETSHQ